VPARAWGFKSPLRHAWFRSTDSQPDFGECDEERGSAGHVHDESVGVNQH
jgi:hypothetical protein